LITDKIIDRKVDNTDCVNTKFRLSEKILGE